MATDREHDDLLEQLQRELGGDEDDGAVYETPLDEDEAQPDEEAEDDGLTVQGRLVDAPRKGSWVDLNAALEAIGAVPAPVASSGKASPSRGRGSGTSSPALGGPGGVATAQAVPHGRNISSSSSTTAAAALAATDTADASSTSSLPAAAKEVRTIHQTRSTVFEQEIHKTKINRRWVAEQVFVYGVPESRGMRSLVWKLLLGYLPWDRDQWESELARNRALYASFVAELVTNPYRNHDAKSDGTDADGISTSSSSLAAAVAAEGGDGAPDAAPQRPASGQRKLTAVPVSAIDDPLGVQKGSEWARYFEDMELRKEIKKDIERTYADFHFFNQPVIPAGGGGAGGGGGGSASASGGSSGAAAAATAAAGAGPASAGASGGDAHAGEKHHDVLLRVLFVFARLNPGIRYIQGMNEVMAPTYYVFANDPNPSWRAHAEADTFFCFCNVMADLRDRFIKSLDGTTSGIISAVRDMNELLRLCDRPVWEHLERLGVDPRFYSFRWLTTNLAQEFDLPDLLRIWDSLYADPDRFTFQMYVCVAMVVCARDRLLQLDFAGCLQLLQDYPHDIDVQVILATAVQIKSGWSTEKWRTDPSVTAGRVVLRGDEGRPPPRPRRDR